MIALSDLKNFDNHLHGVFGEPAFSEPFVVLTQLGVNGTGYRQHLIEVVVSVAQPLSPPAPLL
jgi:hypothetical protein